MERRLEATEANARRRGITEVVLTNVKTGKERCVGLVYRLSAKDPGVIFNYCPYCGEIILFISARELKNSGLELRRVYGVNRLVHIDKSEQRKN